MIEENNQNKINEANETLPMKTLFSDMAKYAPSKLCGLVGNVLIVPLYTNLMSKSQYGTYVVALSVLSFFCILFSDWVGLSGLRFFRKNELCDRIPDYLSTLLSVLAFNLCVMLVLAYVFRTYICSYFYIEEQKIFWAILLLVFPVALRALLFQLLRAQIKPLSFTISTIINQCLTIGLSVLLIKVWHFGAISVLIAMGLSISVVDLLLIYQSDILKYLKWIKPDFSMIRSMFVYGLPIALAAISIWCINQSIKFITGIYYGLDGIGLVGVVSSMTFSVLITLLSVITTAAFPRIINLYEDKNDVRPVISKLSAYYVLLALPIVLLMCIYSKDLVTLFANSNYIEAHKLLPYFAFGAFFFGFTDYTTMQYHLSKKTYILTGLKVFSGLIGLLLNFYFIKTLGLVGAGAAILLSNILYFVLSTIFVVPNFEWKIPFKKFAIIALAFVVPAIIWILIKNSCIYPLCQMGILITVYYYCYYVLRNITNKKST